MGMSTGRERGGRRRRLFVPELALGIKVIIAATGMVALLIGTTLGAIFAVIEMKDDQQQITHGELSYGEDVGTAALNAKGIANDERGFLLSGTRSFLVEAKHRLAITRDAFSRAESAAATPRQRAAVLEASRGFERWISTLFDQEIAAYKGGDRQGAVDLSLGESRELRKAYESSLTRAQSLDGAQRAAAQRSITMESSHSVEALVVVLLVAVAADVAIATWLVRAIALPVSRLVTLLTKLNEPNTGTA